MFCVFALKSLVRLFFLSKSLLLFQRKFNLLCQEGLNCNRVEVSFSLGGGVSWVWSQMLGISGWPLEVQTWMLVETLVCLSQRQAFCLNPVSVFSPCRCCLQPDFYFAEYCTVLIKNFPSWSRGNMLARFQHTVPWHFFWVLRECGS